MKRRKKPVQVELFALPEIPVVEVVKKPDLLDKTVEMFCLMWEEKYEARYYPDGGDRSQLGRLLRSLPREALSEMEKAFAGYLNDNSEFLTNEVRHSLRYFASQGFNKYRVIPRTRITSERERRSAQAAKIFAFKK